MYYVVTYNGPFGFIKPWTAVRDSETFSQQFLTPSILEGIRQKLGVKSLLRHRLTYAGISMQQEVTQPRGWEYKKSQKMHIRKRAILMRGVLLEPTLHLACEFEADALQAAQQHICLCRNEDVLLPEENVRKLSGAEFDLLDGFELRFGEGEDSFMVGFDRFNNGMPMYGRLVATDNPLKSYEAF